MTDLIRRWNADKPHRCPECHAVAIDMERPSRWKSYRCCRCGIRFARSPRLAGVLPYAGVMCSVDRPGAARIEAMAALPASWLAWWIGEEAVRYRAWSREGLTAEQRAALDQPLGWSPRKPVPVVLEGERAEQAHLARALETVAEHIKAMEVPGA